MLNLTPTSLLSKDISGDYPCLSDDLDYRLDELLKGIHGYVSTINPITLGYSLSNCQGDGVEFSSGEIEIDLKFPEIKTLLKRERIKQSQIDSIRISFKHKNYGNASRYTHENSFNIYLLIEDKEGNTHEPDLLPSQEKIFRDICKELEKYGYDIIESGDIDSINFHAFERFKAINNIVGLESYYDYPYINDDIINPEYTLIATDGDTSLKSLQVKLPPLQPQTRTITESFISPV